MRLDRFAIFAWLVLAVNIGVILWGAYVRATGSGAGCGSHWPLCNGEVLPTNPEIATIVEFTHRLTSGLALVLVISMFIWGLRRFPKGHIIRIGVWLSLCFIITEALVGAGLVLFRWVALDDSIERVISMAVHLINTFLLLAALTLTAWWASGAAAPQLKDRGKLKGAFLVAFLGVLVLGVTGAITALGDTLFPSQTLAQGIQADFSATAHFLVRLRIWHPLIAVTTGIIVVVLALLVGLSDDRVQVRRIAMMLGLLFFLQLVVGLVNLFLLAPVPMQIVHLFIADLVWISLVLFAASVFGEFQTPDAIQVQRQISDSHSEFSSLEGDARLFKEGA